MVPLPCKTGEYDPIAFKTAQMKMCKAYLPQIRHYLSQYYRDSITPAAILKKERENPGEQHWEMYNQVNLGVLFKIYLQIYMAVTFVLVFSVWLVFAMFGQFLGMLLFFFKVFIILVKKFCDWCCCCFKPKPKNEKNTNDAQQDGASANHDSLRQNKNRTPPETDTNGNNEQNDERVQLNRNPVDTAVDIPDHKVDLRASTTQVRFRTDNT